MKSSNIQILTIAIIAAGLGSAGLLYYSFYGMPVSNQASYPSIPVANGYIQQQNSLTFVRSNSGNAIGLTWQPVVLLGNYNVVKYNVYRSTISGQEVLVGYSGPNQFAFLDASVQQGQIYYYYVTAQLSNGVTGIIAPEIAIQD